MGFIYLFAVGIFSQQFEANSTYPGQLLNLNVTNRMMEVQAKKKIQVFYVLKTYPNEKEILKI